jgi:hypothetical protein
MDGIDIFGLAAVAIGAEFVGVTLNPPPDGDVVGVQAPLDQQLLHITIGKRKTQIPADGKHDHLRFKLAPLEQTGN